MLKRPKFSTGDVEDPGQVPVRQPAGRGGVRHGVQGVRHREGEVLHGEDGRGRGGHGGDARRVQDAQDAQSQELYQVEGFYICSTTITVSG